MKKDIFERHYEKTFIAYKIFEAVIISMLVIGVIAAISYVFGGY